MRADEIQVNNVIFMGETPFVVIAVEHTETRVVLQLRDGGGRLSLTGAAPEYEFSTAPEPALA